VGQDGSGLLAGLFRQAGLKNISVKEVTGKLNCKTADVYWNVMTDLATPVVAALNNTDEILKEKIKREVYQAVNEKYPGGNVLMDSSALIIYGEKQSADHIINRYDDNKNFFAG